MKARFTLHGLMVLVLFMAGATVLSAQPIFKILAVRGDVTLKSKSVKIGQQLAASDQLVLGKSGYISLAHKNGRTLELNKSGSYKVKDLDAKASKKTGSSTSKFAKYVSTQLTEVDDPIEFADNRRTKMRTTGSVERAAGDEVSLWDSVLAVVGAPGEMQALAGKEAQAIANGDILAIVSPTHTRLLGDSVAFMWHRSPAVTTYNVVVIDRENAVVKTLSTNDTVIISSVVDLGIKPGQVYYWYLQDKANPGMHSDQFALFLLEGEERVAAEEMLAGVRSDFNTEDEAIGKLILASAFEEMGLYYDALMTYRAAVGIAPDVQNYKRMYADFLKRQGMDMDAYAVYR